MHVLVTGGCGFIGSNLVHRLVKEDYRVHVLDDLSSGKLDNLKDVLGKIVFNRIDVTDKTGVEKAVSNVDAIFHLAAQISVNNSIKEPERDAAVNIGGTVNLLQSSVNFGVKKFIFYSSAAVYGEPSYVPIDEAHPKNPLSPYGQSKLAAEGYVELYNRLYRLNCAVIRPFNVYGPRQDPKNPYTGVISIFLDKAMNNDDIPVYGDGLQTRDFIYIDDLVELSMKILKDESSFRVFNAACGRKISIIKLAESIRELTASKSVIIHLPRRGGEIYESYADIESAENAVGFKPKFTVESGLKEFIRYLKNR